MNHFVTEMFLCFQERHCSRWSGDYFLCSGIKMYIIRRHRLGNFLINWDSQSVNCDQIKKEVGKINLKLRRLFCVHPCFRWHNQHGFGELNCSVPGISTAHAQNAVTQQNWEHFVQLWLAVQGVQVLNSFSNSSYLKYIKSLS